MDIDKAAETLEYTDKEKEFIQVWLGKWNLPRDWSKKAILDDMSPLPRFMGWLDRETTSLMLVLQCLKEFPSNEMPPRLSAVIALYKRKCGRDRGLGQASGRCQLCWGAGIVITACGKKQKDGPAHIIDPQRPEALEKVFDNGVPCTCAAGTRLNGGTGLRYGMRVRERAVESRVTSSEFYVLRRRCMEMAGIELPERKEIAERQPVNPAAARHEAMATLADIRANKNVRTEKDEDWV